jgi:hypothetical protein
MKKNNINSFCSFNFKFCKFSKHKKENYNKK